jgi:hypothetical protein
MTWDHLNLMLNEGICEIEVYQMRLPLYVVQYVRICTMFYVYVL